jgi:hypothetical protein
MPTDFSTSLLFFRRYNLIDIVFLEGILDHKWRGVAGFFDFCNGCLKSPSAIFAINAGISI